MSCVRFIEDELFRTILPAEEVAGIVVEPIQGEGGYLVPPKAFLEELRRLADRHGILLIFDEVQCGMGRTGKMWASEHFGVAPDIFTTAKGIASGLPLSAMIARADVMNWGPGAHASTFGGNPVAVAAALATIELLESELIANAAHIGGHILDRLRDWPKRFRHVGDVRGLGLMIGFELVRDQQTKERAPELRDRIQEMAFERGLLVLGAGRNTIRLCPPLVITRDQADFAIGYTGGMSQSRWPKLPPGFSTSAAASTNTPAPSAWIAMRTPAPTCCATWTVFRTRFATARSVSCAPSM